MEDLVNIGPAMIRLVRNKETTEAEIVGWSPMTNMMAVLFSLEWDDVPKMLQRLSHDWVAISQQKEQWFPPWHKEIKE